MEAKMNKRRKYDRDFKRNAVLLCSEPGRTVKEHGIEALTEEQKRIRELEKKLRETEMERDILKKAMAIFSRAPK